MKLQNILYEKAGLVGTISLNRPQKLNALNFDLLDELWEVLQVIAIDEDVSVIVLTGSGKYFSAGADLEILGSLTTENFRINQRRYWNKVFGEMEDIPKLTIAAINGPAIGGGVELALTCDLRYAAMNATLRMPQINFGLLPDAGGTIYIPRLMGLARAKEFIFSGEPLAAPEAAAMGLINRVFPAEEFQVEVKRIAARMAAQPPLALSLGKKHINRSFQERDVKFGLEDVIEVQTVLIGTEDYREGIRALREKSKPVFKGK